MKRNSDSLRDATCTRTSGNRAVVDRPSASHEHLRAAAAQALITGPAGELTDYSIERPRRGDPPVTRRDSNPSGFYVCVYIISLPNILVPNSNSKLGHKPNRYQNFLCVTHIPKSAK